MENMIRRSVSSLSGFGKNTKKEIRSNKWITLRQRVSNFKNIVQMKENRAIQGRVVVTN